MNFRLISIHSALILFLASCQPHHHSHVEENGPDVRPNEHFFAMRGTNGEPMDLEAFNGIGKFLIQRDNHEFRSSTASWTQEGPFNIGGRINTIAVHPQNEDIILVGSTAGGVFRTDDGGSTWAASSDELAYMSIGCIVFDSTDPNVIYIGTGDPNISGLPSIGNGVYKSTDGGISWEQIGLENERIISRIIVHPTDPNILFAGAMGLPFERDDYRGLYRSNDAGATWEQVLFVSDEAGIIDLAINQEHPDTLYASSWNRIRNNTESMITGPDAKIWRSFDGGDNWESLTNGLPQDTMSRIGICVFEDNPAVLYAIYVGTDQQIHDLYKSTDHGDSWNPFPWVVNQMNNALGGFGWYFGQIRVNPNDEDEVTVLGVDMYTTTDGGNSWFMSTPVWWEYDVHADKHDMIYTTSGDILLATDGGLYRADSNFDNWEDIDAIPNSQIYRIGLNPHNPEYYTVGCQDNGTTTGNESVANSWVRDYGGDGFQAIYDPFDEDLRYTETQNGGLVYNDGFGWSGFTGGITSSDRVNWDAPIIMSPHNNEVMYTATFRVYRNPAAPYGFWNPISEDLTDGIIYGENFHTISALEESRVTAGLLYSGTTDGNVWVKMPGSLEWNNVTGSLPEQWVTSIKSSPENESNVWVTHSGYKNNDQVAHIHHSTDYGATWMDASGDLPNVPVNHIEVVNDTVLCIATDFGVYFTDNGGTNWERVGNNMPMIPVFDLEIDTVQHKLLAGTFARSLMSFPMDSLWMAPDIITDIDDLAIEPALTIWPNPSQNFVNVILYPSDSEYRLHNTRGQVVRRGDTLGTTNLKIDIQGLTPGIYHLVVIGSDETYKVETLLVQ